VAKFCKDATAEVLKRVREHYVLSVLPPHPRVYTSFPFEKAVDPRLVTATPPQKPLPFSLPSRPLPGRRILTSPHVPSPRHPPTHLARAYVPMCPCACSSPTTTRSSPTP
jgi:hypothetical protein